MGLQLIEGTFLIFGNELWAIDGQLLVGIHGNQHAPNVGLQPGKKVKERSGGRNGSMWTLWPPPSGAPTCTHINLFVLIA